MATRASSDPCATKTGSINRGTRCPDKAEPPCTLGHREIASKCEAPKNIKFSELWDAYPSDHPYKDSKGQTPKGYENQCAIKVSVALAGAGVKLVNFHGASVQINGSPVAVRAEELTAWLSKEVIPGISAPEEITGEDWEKKIKGRTGIVSFKDYWLRPGEKTPTGDHIDLWNGSRLTMSGFEGTLVTSLRYIGISSGPGFSDLGKSKKILFWQIK